MGVPKFFRYISERYPSLSELVRENQIPEFDHLYLDMNGIIHVCSHPNDFDPHFRISEEKIFNDICRYIEILFRMIQPQKLFLMAIDGVAPRAKMNQQRGRRFRSAKEAQTLENDAKSKGELLPTEARFDSNCITPGTSFMVRLQEHLKYFVKAKLSTDALWQKCRIILSGHETPGEGEHKIMEYIRYLKASPGYDPDTRHCLYGLDADLIMLGLCSHEPHFSLLREEVKFGKQANKRLASAEETRFFLLHLTLLREYLEQEFWPIKANLPFPYDIESIIDDWVLMGFLVGNDFVPHLPHLHIQTNALPMLYDAYMKIIPTLDGYINEGGILNLSRLEEFMSKLAHVDRENFQDINGDLKYFEGKKSANPWKKTSQNDSETFDVDVASIKAAPSDLQDLIQATEDMFLDESPEGESNDEYPAEDIRYKKKDIMDMTDEEVLDQEFSLYKRDYYITKLGYAEVTPEVLAEQAECYVRALQWILLYYYRGVRSWGWFYPHHYAPFISDISGFKHLKLDFLMGKPFLPFQQLLAVLPAASGTLLPEAYRNLMVSPDSPVIHYYPSDFQTDMNGKQQEWEAVVLIPFIEENLLINSMKKCECNLTPEEVARNIHGPMLQYDYNPIDQGQVSGKDGFPDLPHNFSTETKVSRSELEVPTDRLVLGPCKGAKFDVFFPGFPTMKHLKYTSRLEKKAVKVFDQPSRGHNMIISITHEDGDVAYNIAKDILGKNIFVAWPHLMEAKVIAVSDQYKRYHYSQECDIRTEDNTGNLRQQWTMSIKNTTDHYMNRLGVDVGKTSILVHVLTMIGRKYIFGNKGKITLEKQFTTLQSTYPYQACVRDISVNDPTFVQYKSINEVFSSGLTVFMLGYPHYGCTGEVVDVNPNPKECRIRLSILRKSEPDLTIAQQIYREISSQYMTGHEAASKLGFSSYIVGRITGTVYIIPGEKTHRPPLETTKKINVGLNLKFTKKNEEISGYCRKVGPAWLYSFSTVKLISDYMDKYPQLFQLMGNKNVNNDVFYEYDLFPNEKDKGKLSELVKWLKEQPHSSAERRPCGSEAASKPCIEEIMKAVESVKNSQMRKIVLLVKPVHLYVPGLERTSMSPDPKAEFKMFDRVTNVRESYTVPLGQTGTVVATHQVIDPNPVHQNSSSEMLLDVLFDEPFPGGSSFEGIAEGRLFRLPLSALVNISYGERMETNSQKVSTHNASNKNSVENKTAKENMSWRSREPVVEANASKGSLETALTRTPNAMNASDVSSTKYQTLWNDLHKKQQENTSVPIQNNSTVILKQMLGVSVQDARNNSAPFLPRAQQQQQQPPPPQQQQPTNVNMSVQDFFNQARANTVVAPVLPQPPHQWYGYPPGVDNVQNWRQHSSPPRQQGAQSPRRHPQEYNVSNSMHKPLNQPNSPIKSIQRGLVQNLQQQADRQFSNHPLNLTAGVANPNQNTSSQQRLYSSHSNTLSDHVHKTSGHNRHTHSNANNSSAFIPLQAIKKERLKSASSAQIQNQRPRTSDELNRQSRQDTSHKRQVVEQKQQASQQQFQKYLHTSQPTDGKKDTGQPMIPSERKVRKSRIAANFGPTE